jgi:protein-S-isoprenylcysteine O-methyltransferase Ste14
MSKLYSWFAILGLGSVGAVLAIGFRHDPDAPSLNYAYNAALFIGYMAIHYLMMTPAFKKLVSKSAQGSSAERRLYMVVAIVTWVAMYAIHKPMPGLAFTTPDWLYFVGACAFLMSFLAFNEGTTFEALKSFSGVSGTVQTHGAAIDAPLQTEGSYASVRHPMYRGAVLMGLSSLLLHPNTAQLAWVVTISLTFASFIPIEEKQLIQGRGDEYRNYMKDTPYRIFRGIW